MKCFLPCIAAGLLSLVQLPGSLGAALEGIGYETTQADVTRICGELHQALDPKERQQISPRPLLWPQVSLPFVQPGLTSEGARAVRSVQISAGLVAFLNHLAHARAIDLAEPGYLKQYLITLAGETGEQPLAGLTVAPRSPAWSFDIRNHQVSHFNQMAATLLAINLAHHCLGHYDKYAPRLTDAQQQAVPINAFLTESEWRKAVLAGAHNALSCGFGIEGFKVLLAALDSMPSRPPWTLYLAPANLNVSKTHRDLIKLEKKFFLLD